MQLRCTLVSLTRTIWKNGLSNQTRLYAQTQLNSISKPVIGRAFDIKPTAKRLINSQGTQIRLYSADTSPINKLSLNPFFITGLMDAEGTFVTIIKKNNNLRIGWRVEVVFQIGLHKKDLELLKLVQTYFGGVGVITKPQRDMCAFRITSPNQIAEKILPHFDKFPLVTNKLADYLLFKEVVLMVLRGEHRNEEGLQSIVNLRASLNLGLSEVLKVAFPDTVPVARPNTGILHIPHPEWMAGFTTGEGCFFVKVNKGRNNTVTGINLVFQVAQHVRDKELMKSFVTFFGCGRYIVPNNKEWGYFQCTKFTDNCEKIQNFFLRYPIRGAKSKDFADWVKVAEIIKRDGKRTQEGTLEILKIKENMNKGRQILDILSDQVLETD